MRKLILALALLALSTAAQAGETLRMAVTTSFHNSGLAEVLLPRIKADLDLDVQLLVVGTGQALRLGRAGDVDAILVHSRAAEEAFVTEGYGTHRREIMYNDFVLVGPSDDPARISGSADAVAALRAIASNATTFVSRGDDSGTHKKELRLWQGAGLAPEDFERWYRSVGAGMGAALNAAAGMDAYILADRASWLNFGNKAGLALLFAGDPELFNQYAYLPVNPDRHPHVQAAQAGRLEAWLVSPVAQALIDGYQIGGETLFVFNATP
ncbi:ABC-type tungstate transport system, periplasmic binding protein [Candidatus Rhodobacter oscarellae]|uniref:ABC-type tungstate transport system, periplasmic binding protein n=1 Tax=Candidatus Rhodobacter oscarellae TaxID=1675527 RepID=A0A0J9EA12_9RHOB|nr:substrate-binding domain-containing protein [Candidatus Rhodobacter lobularis]KMW59612.1 ABC-type tungstate transport system, periplasmic binding protein [Candidatus Rhodobacter lobularis]